MSTPNRFDDIAAAALDHLDASHALRAIVRRDGRALARLRVSTQLGWLRHVALVREHIERLTILARVTERQGYDRAVVLGDGGGWSDVIGRHLRGKRGMKVCGVSMDYALPTALSWASAGRPLFVVIEGPEWSRTLGQYRACRRRFDRGADYVAVGRRGGPAATLADEGAFRDHFAEVNNLEGAFAATGLAGMVPAVLAGVVLTDALARIEESVEQSSELIAQRNPAAQLGAFLWAAERTGRWQLHLSLSRDVSALGGWISRLIAQVTEPASPAIPRLLPLLAGPNPSPLSAGQRAVAAVVGASTFDQPDAPGFDELDDRGVPSHSVVMPSVGDLWAEAVRWQMAAVVLAALRADDATAAAQAPDGHDRAADTAADGRGGAAAPAAVPAEARQRFTGAVASIKALAGALRAELDAGTAGDVLVVLAHVPPTEANGHRLEALRARLQRQTAARVIVDPAPTDARHYAGVRGQIIVISESASDAETGHPTMAREAREAAALLQATGVSTRCVRIG